MADPVQTYEMDVQQQDDLVCRADDHNPAVDAQLAGGQSQAQQQAPARPPPSLERGLASAKNAIALTELVRAALVPAYRKAVDAVDPLAAMEMATHVVSAYSGIDRTREDLEINFPGGDPTRWMVSTPDSPVGDTTDMTEAKWTELRGDATQLTVEAPALSHELLSQLGPQSFRGNEVLGGAAAPAAKKDGPTRVTNEAGRVVELLAVVVRARGLAGSDGNSCVALDEGQQTSIAALIEPYRTRPIDLAFLVEVLRAECLWESIEGARGPSGHTLAGTLDKTLAQAKETGAFQDMGDWDIEKVSELLRSGDDNTAHQVFLELKYLPASARGPAIRQIERMGLLESFCGHMPWKYIEALHGVIAEGDSVAASLLLPYFEDEGGGKSLHKEYEENAMDNIEEGGFINHVNAFGWVFLDTAHNALTGGFLHEYSAAYDAREQGWITEDEFDSASMKALGKAAVITLAGAAVGGAAGAWAEGVATGLNAGKSAAAVIGGGVGGFAGGVAGHFAGDVYDQLLNDKEGFDSVGSYMQSGAVGGVAGTVLAGVSVAAGRYLPASQQRMIDIYATRYPRMTRVLDDIRASGENSALAGRAAGARAQVWVKMKVQEIIDFIDSGMGGGPTAFATAGYPNIRALPPDMVIDVRLGTPAGMNRPMMMSGDKDPADVSAPTTKEDGPNPDAELPKIEVEEIKVDPANMTTADDTAAATVAQEFRLQPADVDAAVEAMQATGRLTGDTKALAKTINDAKAGQSGALGELEAIQRWLAEGKRVEVQEALENSGVRNPDYRVDGKMTEIKARNEGPSKRWIKDKIHGADDQLEKSLTKESGDIELLLRGEDAAMDFADIERQVKGSFNASRALHVDRVAVYQDGVLVGEWIRTPAGVTQTYP